jgi:pSer/pThr/pTyr-binding forkhead associated (FHA) protein
MVNLILFVLKFVFLFLFYVLVISIARGIFKDTAIPKIETPEIRTGKLQLLSSQGNVISEVDVNKEAVIGRSEKADLEIDDDFASYSHSKVIKENQNYYVQDLKSTNGTYLNSAKINKARLSDGDIIAIGKTKIKFKFDK